MSVRAAWCAHGQAARPRGPGRRTGRRAAASWRTRSTTRRRARRSIARWRAGWLADRPRACASRCRARAARDAPTWTPRREASTPARSSGSASGCHTAAPSSQAQPRRAPQAPQWSARRPADDREQEVEPAPVRRGDEVARLRASSWSGTAGEEWRSSDGTPTANRRPRLGTHDQHYRAPRDHSGWLGVALLVGVVRWRCGSWAGRGPWHGGIGLVACVALGALAVAWLVGQPPRSTPRHTPTTKKTATARRRAARRSTSARAGAGRRCVPGALPW